MNRNERKESSNRANLQKKEKEKEKASLLLILLFELVFFLIFDGRDTCTSLYAKKKELIEKKGLSTELIKKNK